MIGRIYSYNNEKEFGFIRSANKQSFFFHKSNVKFEKIEIGTLVSFEVRLNPKTKKTISSNIKNLTPEYLNKTYKLNEPLNNHT